MLRLAWIALASLVPTVALAQSAVPRPTPSPAVRTTPGPAAGSLFPGSSLPGATGVGLSQQRSTRLQPPPAGALRTDIRSRLPLPGSSSTGLPATPTQRGAAASRLGVSQPAPGVPLAPPGVPLAPPGLGTNAPGPTGTGESTSSLPALEPGLGAGIGAASATPTPIPTSPPTP